MRLALGDTAFMIFGHLALHESERLTLAELATASGRPDSVALKALRGLIADGLVVSEAKALGTGRGQLYRVNAASPIFPELRQIVVKMLGGTGLVRDVIERNPVVDAAAIFGSVAAGTDRRKGSLSDIDLLLIFTDESTREERFAVRSAISELAERLNRQISVQAQLRGEWAKGRLSDRVLRRIAEGSLLVLKGTI
jgi:predicted nucleotidyltransferase